MNTRGVLAVIGASLMVALVVGCAALMPQRTLDGAAIRWDTNGVPVVKQDVMLDLQSSDVVTAIQALRRVNGALNPTPAGALTDSILSGAGVLLAAFGGWLLRHKTQPSISGGVVAAKVLDSGT